jgi:hypothetical protein
MEEKFKSIPLTILDILGIFIPGSVWLVLLVTTFRLNSEVTIEDGISPLTSCKTIGLFFQDLNSPLLAALVFIVASLLIGYTIRPIAMGLAEWFSLPFQKFHNTTWGFKLNELKFPFTKLFEKEPYYQKILTIVENVTGCKKESLPRHPPFSAAKRYLRLISPSLWEESERREAEVRMVGGVLLAMIYSLILSLIVIILQYIKPIQFHDKTSIWFWLVVSFVAVIILSLGFCRLRYGEVANTYLNTLIAYRHFVRNEPKKKKK